ncbi:MAG: CAP domain-containing protein [Marinoscillum sp.]
MLNKIFPLTFLAFGVLLSACSKDEFARPNIETLRAEIFEKVNEHRISIGLIELEASDLCTQMANEHSQNMANGQVEFSHDGFKERFDAASTEVGASSAGENLASNFTSADQLVKGWLSSPPHKENLEGDYTHMGIGIATDGNGNTYFTQFLIKI